MLLLRSLHCQCRCEPLWSFQWLPQLCHFLYSPFCGRRPTIRGSRQVENTVPWYVSSYHSGCISISTYQSGMMMHYLGIFDLFALWRETLALRVTCW
ncbi:hypothetical protein HanRHA438_Chr01g0018021 [Helianthus annuus]|nr:hypothetical protein HanRHA438_Chr01g0018021 [Helianthus annuus]